MMLRTGQVLEPGEAAHFDTADSAVGVSPKRRLTTSVLIPSFRRPARLTECLKGLARQTVPPTEVFVVWQSDDESTREAAEQAAKWTPFRLAVLHSPESGVVPAENLALHFAEGEFVFLIDDDAIPCPEWIERHLAHYEDASVGAVGGPAEDFYEDGRPFPKRAVEPIGRLRWYGGLIGNMYDHVTEWRQRAPIEVDHLVGYNFSIRRSAFGTFEGQLRPYWQFFEADACFQVKARGHRVLFDFANVVEHHPTNTAYIGNRGGNLAIKVYNSAYNHAFILAKHSSFHLRAVRLAYLLGVGTVGAPGLAASLVAMRRFGNWTQELHIVSKTLTSHLAGWRDGSSKRRLGNGETKLRSPILMFATQGAGGDDEQRLRRLLRDVNVSVFAFEKNAKMDSFARLVKTLLSGQWDLVVMEGTGFSGGLALLLARLLKGSRYLVSSGDAVGPFLALRHPYLRPLFECYEKMLYRYSAGFIGWTPYLVGRALTFGARRAITAPGWAPFVRSRADLLKARTRVRMALGIPADAVVFGIAGALAWNRRLAYCYGAELVRALRNATRPNFYVLIVGDGDGHPHLAELAGEDLGKRIILTGRVKRHEVPDYLAAMDVGSLPQSVDQVGSFRYTTKLSEYLAAGLPVVTGEIPVAYDLDQGWLWRLPGDAPWDKRYLAHLTELMNGVTPADIQMKRTATAQRPEDFDEEAQSSRVANFIYDLLRKDDR